MKRVLSISILCALFLPMVAGIFAITVNATVTRSEGTQALGIYDNLGIAPNSVDTPININGDADIATYASSGSGTAADPYIIEDKILDTASGVYITYQIMGLFGPTTKSNMMAVSIRNTNAYILVRNITITSDNYSIPVFLENAKVTLESVHTFGGDIAIYLRGDFSDPTNPLQTGEYSLLDCSVTGGGWNNAYGVMINLENAGTVYMEGNEVINAPLLLEYRIGAYMKNTLSVIMRNNKFTDCAPQIDEAVLYSLNYDIDRSNTVNSRQMIYLANQNGFILDEAIDGPAGQISVVNCTNFEIRNFNMKGGGNPITVRNSHHGLITGITLVNFTWDGILANMIHSIIVEKCDISWILRGGILFGFSSSEDPADRNIIRDNVVYNCGRNIRLLMASNDLVQNNTVYWSQDLLDLALMLDPNFEAYGMEAQSPVNVVWEGNHISNCTIGIGFGEFYNIRDSENFTIRGNTIVGIGKGTGLYLQGNDVVVEGNDICCFEKGIEASLQRGIISKNTIHDNKDAGLIMWGVNVSVYLNNFINNNEASPFDQAYDYGLNNTWYLDGVGNYWSNYADKYPGAMNDGNTWDTPWEISWGSLDLYPLVNPYTEDPIGDALNSLLVELDALNTAINVELSGVRRLVCKVMVGIAIRFVDTIVETYQEEGTFKACKLNPIVVKIVMIEKLARNEVISDICADVIDIINALQEG